MLLRRFLYTFRNNGSRKNYSYTNIFFGLTQMLTCGLFKRNTHDGCIKLLSKQADNLYTPEQYENTILFILGQCVVQTQGIEQTMVLTRAIREGHKNDLKMSRMPSVKGRPRLRLVSILFICLKDMTVFL